MYHLHADCGLAVQVSYADPEPRQQIQTIHGYSKIYNAFISIQK